MNPWDAEVELSVGLVTRLLRAQFPDLEGDVRLLGSGWDNDVFAVGSSLAFRFPRRSAALPLMQRELAVLPSVSGLALPVPVPHFHGVPGEGYPWPFWGGPLVPGVELSRAPAAPRAALGTAVGGFLRALHALAPEVDLPHDPMRRGDPAHRAVATREALATLVAAGLLDASSYPVLDEAEGVGASDERVLVHGDLHLRHVLVHPDGAAAGVIDWGDCCWADPSVDLSFAFAALEGPARGAFLTAYGGIDAGRELRARVLALNLCAMLALSAHDTGDEPVLRESLAGVARAQG